THPLRPVAPVDDPHLATGNQPMPQTGVVTNRPTLSERPARDDAGALERGQLRATPGFYQRAWRRFRRDRVSLAALGVTILVVAFVLGADVIARYVTGHDYYTGNLFDQFKPPLT